MLSERKFQKLFYTFPDICASPCRRGLPLGSAMDYRLTQAQRDALRARGLSDEDIAIFTPEEAEKVIRNITPEQAQKFLNGGGAAPLEPDRDQLEIFIQGMFRHCGQGGFVSLRAFYEGNSTKPFRITPISLKGGLKFLVDAAEDDARRAGNDPKSVVFCPPIGVFASKERAREQDLLEAPVFSVELDQNPRAALAILKRWLGPATFVVRSGGQWTNPETGEVEDKLHAHWRLRKPARGEDIARLKQLRKLATALVGGDPSNVPACHPIRWPGSWHRKGAPRLCKIISPSDHLDNEIDLDAALATLEAAIPPRKKDDEQGEWDISSGLDWHDAFSKIIAGSEFHPTLVPLAASFAARGVPEAQAIGVLHALLTNTKTDDPARIARRDTELAKLESTVRSGYEKFALEAQAPDYSANDGAAFGYSCHLIWHGETDSTTARKELVQDLLPETGVALISGQWGTYKTFVADDLSAAVMTATTFANRQVMRKGGVLFLACEGQSEVDIRLTAAFRKHGGEGNAPFAWANGCPRLLDPNAGKITRRNGETRSHQNDAGLRPASCNGRHRHRRQGRRVKKNRRVER
jgi:hypothetical protein